MFASGAVGGSGQAAEGDEGMTESSEEEEADSARRTPWGRLARKLRRCAHSWQQLTR